MTAMRLVTVFLATALATLALGAAGASALEVETFDVETSTTKAGGHPDLRTTIDIDGAGEPDTAKDLVVDMPAGLFGNPQAITNCRGADFSVNACPVGAQAGLVSVRANLEGNPNFILGMAPLYAMDTSESDETARFAFKVPILNLPISIRAEVRTWSDYGLRFTVQGIPQQVPLSHVDLTFWGFPASPTHDVERFGTGTPDSPPGCPGQGTTDCNRLTPRAAGIPVHPLIDNPTVCTDQPLKVALTVRSYMSPASPLAATSDYPASTECDKMTFIPALGAALTTKAADSPAGLNLRLQVPQYLGEATSPSQLRSAEVILPEGLSINPDAADGQTACTDAEARFGTDEPVRCPDTSKIGTFRIGTPALTGPLNGALYIGEPKPGDQYRVIMAASGFGIHAKLVASIQPDPATGQLTMRVVDLPQVPFEEFSLRLFGSDRGLLATPTECRVYSLDSVFTPWNDKLAKQRSRPAVSIETGPGGGPCPGLVRPFVPRLVAGMSSPVAGGFSSFHLRLDRDDGHQYLGDLSFRMPPGFTGYLRGIEYCPEEAIAAAAQRSGRLEQAAPSCPASSQVGTTNVKAGPGAYPFNAVGRMYLAGPFKGARLSLVAVTPALAGPYDYGTQVVRVALQVDPATAQVTAVSDRVPSIIGGVPIRMRSIQVNIDRPNFTINPTNCSNYSVDSQGVGDQGTVSDFSSPFHAVNCASLPFRPRMKVTQLGGRNQTQRNDNPRLRFDLFTRRGDANLRSLTVTLPKAFAIDQAHLGNICSRAELQSKLCDGRQKIGDAWVRTPLLDRPLQGPAYAVSGFGKLPRLAFILDGQVMLVPQAESAATKRGLLRTKVPVIPDAPVGHFRLTLLGGKRGYLVNTRNLCAGKTRVAVTYVGQNGRRHAQRVPMKLPCR